MRFQPKEKWPEGCGARVLIKAVPVLLILCCLCGCQSGQSASDGMSFPRDKTLYIGGLQWGEPNTFNPLSDFPAFPVDGNDNLMYEPLLVYNILNGKMEPMLACSYEVTSDVIRVTMDRRARWSDGMPLTAQDALFTYQLGRRFKDARIAYVWEYVSAITIDTTKDSATGIRAERVNFFINKTRNNPLRILDFLQEYHIVPQHAIEPVLQACNNDFSLFQKKTFDRNPVVSGPYTLFTFSAEKIILKRNDEYWGNQAFFQGRQPRPEYIIHPIYKSNDHFSISLQQGNIDVSQTFIPRIWLKARKKVHTWYSAAPFHIPGSIIMFSLNVTRYPLSDKNVRRAMAAAINYRDIQELAVSGYSVERKPGLILPFGIEAQYDSPEDAAQYGVSYDPLLAKKILKEAGYTSIFDKKGNLLVMKDPSGAVVPTMFINSPTGWTDWETMVRIAVKGMRSAGIDVREGFLDFGLYNQNLKVGDYDCAIPLLAVTPSKPWSRFEAVMSSLNWKAIGEKMNENQGRYNNPSAKDYNPVVDSLIRVIPSLTDAQKKAAYRALNVIFMQDQPAIPLVYRPEMFYEFSVKHWKNFPTDQNPYAPPQCLCFGAGIRALWEIESVNE